MRSHDPPGSIQGDATLPYDGEIAFVDHELGRLLKAVESIGRKKTLVVVVADHGEAFGEHGELSHGHLVQEATIRIPLIMQATGGLGRGVHVDARVSQVDLMPTILSLLGIDAPRDLDGVSLAASARPRPHAAGRGGRPPNSAGLAWSPCTGAPSSTSMDRIPSSTTWLAIRSSATTSWRIAPRTRRRCAALLREQEGPDAGRLGASNVELGANDIARLEALGYITVAVSRRRTGRPVADPKAMLPAMVEMQRLLSHSQSRSHAVGRWYRLILRLAGKTPIDSRAELIRQLERLASESPGLRAGLPAPRTTIYEEEQRPADAARARQRFEALTHRDSP